jgi:hypothetical protein
METTEERANAFLQEGYRDLTTIVFAIQKEDAGAIADAAQNLASNSTQIGAEPLARAARELIALACDPRMPLDAALPSVARAFAEVESEIRGALDRDIPLFI